MQKHLHHSGNHGELVLEVVNIRLKVVILSHFDSEEVVIFLLGVLVGGVLGEKHLSYLLKVMERTCWEGIKSIRDHIFQTRRKDQAHKRLVMGVDHYLVQKISNVLD